ncbi:MAG: mismatch endonuclease Vsr protein [Candidatus Woesebacteria bacterium GW2011_GWA1_39_8]|uniref:Very short patch repair endonuclease n=1 Tax=Candidatus Woesebacteria bacterium GW2011_GWA1_39_8 TaxID=1618552 RepID=A0A0G0SWI8_9BACT|nr:MAG: mismatch endonuclease Vsr protein [Candidatus Woesebacteria bacterium GW2011_GWA1_39_8]
MDKLTKEKRSQNMAQIRSKNTEPEIRVRKILAELGWNYRLHSRKLPGKPDIVISKIKTAIFINGCFWHQHKGCKRCTMPKSNSEYWNKKLEGNIQKQKQSIKDLKILGWKTAIIWECQTKNRVFLNKILRRAVEKTRI